jgi:hypothetical protein
MQGIPHSFCDLSMHSSTYDSIPAGDALAHGVLLAAHGSTTNSTPALADFTNLVSQMHLQDLGEADAVKEQIQQVQEFYGDFLVLSPHHFTIPVDSNAVLINPRAATLSSSSE